MPAPRALHAEPGPGAAPEPQRPRRWPWAILAVALGLRLLLIALAGHYHPFGDPFDYDTLARSLVDHHSYTSTLFAEPGSASALRPPGYPYLLAGIYAVFGKSYLAARVAGALLGTAVVLLVWQIAGRLYGPRAARWASLVAALTPTLAWVSSGLVAENLYLPLMLGAVLLLLCHREAPSWRWALAAGIAVGVSCMARTNGLIVALPLLAGAWTARREWRDPAILLVGLALALAPWTIRNAVVLGTFAPLGTQTGITLVGVYNQEATFGPFYAVWHTPDQIALERPYLHRAGIDEAQLESRFRSDALRFATHHPGYALQATIHHVQQLLEINHTDRASPNSYEEQGVPLGFARTTGRVAIWLLLMLAALGALVSTRRPRRGPRTVWLWAVPAVIFATVMPLLGAPRYRLPADPFLCILAGVALAAAWERVRGRSREPAG